MWAKVEMLEGEASRKTGFTTADGVARRAVWCVNTWNRGNWASRRLTSWQRTWYCNANDEPQPSLRTA